MKFVKIALAVLCLSSLSACFFEEEHGGGHGYGHGYHERGYHGGWR